MKIRIKRVRNAHEHMFPWYQERTDPKKLKLAMRVAIGVQE